MKKSKSRGNLEVFYDLNLYKQDIVKEIIPNKPIRSLSGILKANEFTVDIDNNKIMEKCRLEYSNAWYLKDEGSINRLLDHHLDDRLQAFAPSKISNKEAKEGNLIDILENEVGQTFNNEAIQLGQTNSIDKVKIAKDFQSLFHSDLKHSQSKDYRRHSQLNDQSAAAQQRYRVKQYLLSLPKEYYITHTHTNRNLTQNTPDIILFKSYMSQCVLDLYCIIHKDFQIESIIKCTEREQVITALDLGDFYLSDDKGVCLSKAITYCPMLKHINISSNLFQDDSLHLILQSIFASTQRGIESLNLSKNKLGLQSIRYLASYLSSVPSTTSLRGICVCTLQVLDVSGCGLNDIYCEMLCESLHTNQSLHTLKLADNNFSYIKESDKNGVCAVDEVEEDQEEEDDVESVHLFANVGIAINNLILVNHTLTALDLSSNQLPTHMMLSLCTNLAGNKTIQQLNLSQTNVSDVIAGQLGLALHENHSLRVIDLSNNKIHSKGAVTIAYAAQLKQSAITHIHFKGNPICNKGGMYLFRAMHSVACRATKLHSSFTMAATSEQKQSILNKDDDDDDDDDRILIIDYDVKIQTTTSTLLSMIDDQMLSYCLHDLNLDIHGIHELSLADPYEYSVARMLQDIADIHPLLNFKIVKHLASVSSISADGEHQHNNKMYKKGDKSFIDPDLKSHHPDELWEFIYLNRNILKSKNHKSDSRIIPRYLISSAHVWNQYLPELQKSFNTLRYAEAVKKQKEIHTKEGIVIPEKHWLSKIPKPDHIVFDINTKVSTQLKALKKNSIEVIIKIFMKLNIHFEQEDLVKQIIQQLVSYSIYNTVDYSQLLHILFSSVSNHCKDLEISFEDKINISLASNTHNNSSGNNMHCDDLQSYMKLFGIYCNDDCFLSFIPASDRIIRIISESDLCESASESLSMNRYIKWMLQQQLNIVPEVTEDANWVLTSLQQHIKNTRSSSATSHTNSTVTAELATNKWNLPHHGRIHFEIECTFFPESHTMNILSDRALLALLFQPSSSSSSNKYNITVLNHILVTLQGMSNELHISCEQAEILLSVLLQYQQQQQQQQQQQNHQFPAYSRLYLIERLSYQIISSTEVQRFLVRNLKFPEILKLRNQMGYMFLVLTGNVTGHYILHLDNSFHREIAKKLAIISNYEKYLHLSDINSMKDLFLKQNSIMKDLVNEEIQQNKIENIVFNTSQCSTGECFRNATYNYQFIKLDSGWFQTGSLPMTGILRFDFISYRKPSSSIDEFYHKDIHSLSPSSTMSSTRSDPDSIPVEMLLDILFDKRPIKRNTFMNRLHGPLIPNHRRSEFVKKFKNAISISKLNTINKNIDTDHTHGNQVVCDDNDDDSDKSEENVEDPVIKESSNSAAINEGGMVLNEEQTTLQHTEFSCTSLKAYQNIYLDILKKRFHTAMKEECSKPTVGYFNKLDAGQIPPLTYQHEGYLQIRNLPFYKAISYGTILATQPYSRQGFSHNSIKNYQTTGSTLQPSNNTQSFTETTIVNDSSEVLVDEKTFELFFMRLEVVLLYQTWFSVAEVHVMIKYLYEKKNASIDVLTRCICTLYNRILHRENLYELFQHKSTATLLENNNSSRSRSLMRSYSSAKSMKGRSSPKKHSHKQQQPLGFRATTMKKLSVSVRNTSVSTTKGGVSSSSSRSEYATKQLYVELTQENQLYQEVVHRLGILNLLNRNHPDGRYHLDLSSAEERNAVKLLSIICVIFKAYKWTNVIFYKESLVTPPVFLTSLESQYIDNLPYQQYITTSPLAAGTYLPPSLTTTTAQNEATYLQSVSEIMKTLPSEYLPPVYYCKEDPEGPPKHGHLQFTISA